ncbi:MAG: YidC/Oxa1 family membrane protein insertase [Acidimicrobiales bacterium]|nr:YidC/Oxa1 family membrane protein insertase [Acidimicrobiales bacterium]
MFNFIADVLAFFYDVWPSYGVSIIFLTLAVMIVATPLTLKSTRSMLQMQRLQPELKAIQNRYKDDRQKMNEELMAFYQENGINPLGGCLPMLIQLPIFLVLFRVVQGITRRSTGIGTQLGWIAGRDGAGGTLDVTTIGSTERTFDPENLSIDSAMYERLHQATEMKSWGLDLSRTAQQVVSDNIIEALPYLLLIVIVLASSLYQQRQIQGRNTGAQVNPQQQMIMKILPFMLPVFSFTMPAALVIYFVVSNLYRIGQQAYITRSLYSGDDSPGAQLARQREADRKSSKGADRGSGGRTTPKKGEPTPKRGEPKAAAKGAKGAKGGQTAKGGSKGSGGNKSGGKSGGKSEKTRAKATGAGRTGKAPSRQARGSGRTTEPGSPQHKKRKK